MSFEVGTLGAIIRYFLPVYAVIFFGICIVWRSVLVWRMTGINPVRWGNSQNVQGFVGQMMKVLLGLSGFVIAWFSFFFEQYGSLKPFFGFELPWLRVLGLILLVGSLGLVALAQAQMGASWRIGVDDKNRTELVLGGLFRLSRNPIYLGIMGSAVGFFLVIPNALTLLILFSTYLLIGVQIRLEEEHMRRLHGQAYEDFCKKVRRWI